MEERSDGGGKVPSIPLFAKANPSLKNLGGGFVFEG